MAGNTPPSVLASRGSSERNFQMRWPISARRSPNPARLAGNAPNSFSAGIFTSRPSAVMPIKLDPARPARSFAASACNTSNSFCSSAFRAAAVCAATVPERSARLKASISRLIAPICLRSMRSSWPRVLAPSARDCLSVLSKSGEETSMRPFGVTSATPWTMAGPYSSRSTKSSDSGRLVFKISARSMNLKASPLRSLLPRKTWISL